MDLDIEDGIHLIARAVEKNEEDRAFKMWVSLYPNMTDESFIAFGEYHERLTKKSVNTDLNKVPTQELFNELNEIRKQFDSTSP